MRNFSGSRMSWAERGDADPDEETGVVAVQTTLLHDVIRLVARCPTPIESVADLMTGDDRGLSRREGNPLGLQRIQEVVVDGVGMCTWRGDVDDTGRGEQQD